MQKNLHICLNVVSNEFVTRERPGNFGKCIRGAGWNFDRGTMGTWMAFETNKAIASKVGAATKGLNLKSPASSTAGKVWV